MVQLVWKSWTGRSVWETDTVIITVAARVTESEATAVGIEDRSEATPGTGVRAEFNGIHPTLYIPNIDSSSSAATSPTTMEVNQDD